PLLLASKPKYNSTDSVRDFDDRLPKLSYDTLKEKQIRDKLGEHGLVTIGDRATLVARHQRWTMLWNSNHDKGVERRQKIGELRRELKKWEEDHARLLKKKGDTESIKPDEHLKANRSEFSRLVEEARKSKHQAQIVVEG
ncbi:unnamed protein product, partial [Mycena citricolor]